MINQNVRGVLNFKIIIKLLFKNYPKQKSAEHQNNHKNFYGPSYRETLLFLMYLIIWFKSSLF